MFRKKENHAITSTVIGEGIAFENNKIKGEGSLRIDGKLVGDVEIDGSITIGELGFIKGNVKATHVLIAGKVEGNIESTSAVHLTSSGNLTGNIISKSLVIDEGAIFSGSCVMLNIRETSLVYNMDKEIEEDKKEIENNKEEDLKKETITKNKK